MHVFVCGYVLCVKASSRGLVMYGAVQALPLLLLHSIQEAACCTCCSLLGAIAS